MRMDNENERAFLACLKYFTVKFGDEYLFLIVGNREEGI